MTMSAESDKEQPTTPAEPAPEISESQPELPSSTEEQAEEAEAEVKVVSEQVDDAEEKPQTPEEPATSPPTQKTKVEQSPRGPSKGKRKNQLSLPRVTARFAGCGRCSYFWAGYRVIQGLAELETAVANSQSGWLDLTWDGQMTDLIYRTFGVRLDIEHFHYEGCCKECRRHFVYKVGEEETQPSFRIEITPKVSR